MNADDIKNFISITRSKVDLIEKTKKYYAKETAPLFNSFNFWDMNENKVSEILAFFLDPNGNHQQGDIYLKHFLKKFQINFFTYTETDKIKVKCEYKTDKNRRIDIVIYKNDFEQAIGIENKIYLGTSDQNNQLSDYLKFLDKITKNNYFMIYLSPKEKTISDYSLSPEEIERVENENKFKHLNYEENIIECVREFSLISESLRVKSFLKDFEKTLINSYIGEDNMDTKQSIKEYIIEDPKNIKISFDISNSLQEIKTDLKNKFKEQISDICLELGVEEVSEFRLKPKNWSRHQIRFSYESNGLLFGIGRIKENPSKSRLSDIESRLTEELGVSFMVSAWWPMWQFFYKDVETNVQFYIDINSGVAKERAKRFVKLIVDNFNTSDY